MKLFKKKRRKGLFGKKTKDVSYLVLVIIISISFSIFNILTSFSNKIHSLSDLYTKMPMMGILVNIIFGLLVGLLWATYHRWRIAVERQREAEDIISSINPDALLVVDHIGNIIMCNSKVENIFGYDIREVLNKNTGFLYTLKGTESWDEIYDRMNKEGFHVGLAEGKKKDGGKVALEITAGIMTARKGAVLLLRDITLRKQMEEELQKTLADLERSNNELAQFAYVVSHDLQEPLRMVVSYVQLLEKRYKGKLDSDANDFIWFAVDGATRMRQLINDLLEYSRLSSRGKPFEPIETEEVLANALANLQKTIEENAANIDHGPLPTLIADGSQLNRLFQNLIGNAVKYRGEEMPRIHVGAEQINGEWVFCIQDNGIGIDLQYFERIFKIFQRLHNRTEYPGTGIGLAICKKIVERHCGRIWIESEPGKGSKFYFTIPNHGENCNREVESH